LVEPEKAKQAQLKCEDIWGYIYPLVSITEIDGPTVLEAPYGPFSAMLETGKHKLQFSFSDSEKHEAEDGE
jgi:hypothetical protein